MIIYNFNFNWILFRPLKTNSPLVVDSHGALTSMVTLQLLKVISRGKPKVF